MLVDDVTSHTIGRSNIVGWLKIRKSLVEGIQEVCVLIRDRNAYWASLPNSHQPDSVEAIGTDSVPLGRGNGRQINGPAVFLAQLCQPDPRVDLIHCRISSPS